MSSAGWNIILVGESGVGKTSMMIRYVKEKFSVAYNATVAIDYLFKDVTVDGKDVKLQIWDSAGQEIYKSIIPQYFRIANGCILVYDVTRITTFHKLTGWLSEFRLYNEKAPIIIVGNKSEDPDRKTVGRSVIKSYADLEGMDFMECSAKTGQNVEEVFELLVQKVWKSQMPEHETSFQENSSSNSADEEKPNLNGPISVTHDIAPLPYVNETVEPQSFVITEPPPNSIKETKKKKSCC